MEIGNKKNIQTLSLVLPILCFTSLDKLFQTVLEKDANYSPPHLAEVV